MIKKKGQVNKTQMKLMSERGWKGGCEKKQEGEMTRENKKELIKHQVK